ncbi:MAG: hypothetical protein PF495_09155 [Spirochaetales bacterium]|nr:hypothetical protein [Spirochaetales bacterium]
MKTIWSEDPSEIIAELQVNSDEQVALTLLGPTLAPSFITIRSVVKDDKGVFVEFEKPEGVQLEGDWFVVYLRD